MAAYMDDGANNTKMARPTITSQLDAAEAEIKRQGRLIHTLQSEVETLYTALGIPMPPEPAQDEDSRVRIAR